MTISVLRRTLLVGTLGLALGAGLLGQAVAGEQLGNIKKAGEIKIGLEGTYPPFSFVDENGKLSGFEAELSEALAKELGSRSSCRLPRGTASSPPWNPSASTQWSTR